VSSVEKTDNTGDQLPMNIADTIDSESVALCWYAWMSSSSGSSSRRRIFIWRDWMRTNVAVVFITRNNLNTQYKITQSFMFDILVAILYFRVIGGIA